MGAGDSGAVDIHDLFCHYNALYFHDALGGCSVEWTSSLSPRCAGTCLYHPQGGCQIFLSEPLLKFQPTAHLKNTLLHEMIHAFLWFRNQNKDHSDHGSSFQAMVESIVSSSDTDHQRPFGGYNITIHHEFDMEVDSCRLRHWICQSCGDSICSAINREPSPSDCIENVGPDGYCDKSSCHWHSHKKLCSGSYTEVPEPPACNYNKRSSKDVQELQKNRFKGLQYTTRRTVQRLLQVEGTADKSDCKKNTILNFFPSAAAATGNPGGDSFSKADFQGNVKHQVLKGNKSKTESHVAALEIRKQQRSHVSRQKLVDNGHKRRKLGKCKKDYTVIIKWLDVFTDEESDEDVEPLINKRTERRRKQKELKLVQGQALEIETMDKVSTSQASCGRSDQDTLGGNSLSGHKNVEDLRPSEMCEKKEAQGTTMVTSIEQLPRDIQAHGEQTNMGTTETMNCSASSQPVHIQDASRSNVPIGCGATKIQADSCKDVLPLTLPVSDDVVYISESD